MVELCCEHVMLQLTNFSLPTVALWCRFRPHSLLLIKIPLAQADYRDVVVRQITMMVLRAHQTYMFYTGFRYA